MAKLPTGKQDANAEIAAEERPKGSNVDVNNESGERTMGFKSKINYFYKGKHRKVDPVEEDTEVIPPVKLKKKDQDLEDFVDTLQMLKKEAKEKPHYTEIYASVGDFERKYYLTVVPHGQGEDELWAYLLDEDFNRIEKFNTPIHSAKHSDGFLDPPPEQAEQDWWINYDTPDTLPIIVKAEEFRRALLELGYSRETYFELGTASTCSQDSE